MTPAFRAAGAWAFTPNNVATPATLAPGAPAGVQVGDLLVLVCESRSITATIATPSGWTIHPDFPKRSGTASGGTIYVFLRVADGTASDTPSPVWSGLTTGTTGDASGAGLLAWSGAKAVVDGAAAVSDLSAQTTTTTIPASTTTLPESLVVGIALKLNESSGQTSTVTGRTERADNSTTSGTGHIIEVCDVVLPAPGTTAACTVTWSITTSARALAVSIGLAAVMPTLIDTGLTLSEDPATNVVRAVTDSGLTVTDSAAVTKAKGISITVTGATVTDTASASIGRAIADTGLTLTEDPASNIARLLSDTGLTISDSARRGVARLVAATGATITDSLALTPSGNVFAVTAQDRGIGFVPVVFGPLG